MDAVPASAVPLVCANRSNSGTPCHGFGRLACASCKLVAYCGKECQMADWIDHKKTCKCPLGKPSWRPSWDIEGRDPAWAQGQAAVNMHNPFGGNKYLWGNIPAIDVLKLEQNEGTAAFQEPLALLFAASGDLRSIVKSIVDLPEPFAAPLEIAVNDRDFDVVSRNVIILLFIFATVEDADESSGQSTGSWNEPAQTLIHLWYSAFWEQSAFHSIRARVQPLLDQAWARIDGKKNKPPASHTWSFSSGSTVSLTLPRSQWRELAAGLEVPASLTRDVAQSIRTAVTLAPARADYRGRWFFKDATPSMRVAKQRFREDGLLLPFGHPRTGFEVPNPTLFSSSVPHKWLQCDQATPMAGWPLREVDATPHPPAEDSFGKLFVYLRKMFARFFARLASLGVRFALYNVDAERLPMRLPRDKYARIDVSNITDCAWLGVRTTLSTLMPLLQPPSRNRHAALISLFINAVMEIHKTMGEETSWISSITDFLPLTNIAITFINPTGAEMSRFWDARTLFLDSDKLFAKYEQVVGFARISDELSVSCSEQHTIVEKWPVQLEKRDPGQPGAQREFRLRLASTQLGTERYVEWRRLK